ncbi:hypothetical protein JCM11641_001830 [Rhodosporidiobolus odoratus]
MAPIWKRKKPQSQLPLTEPAPAPAPAPTPVQPPPAPVGDPPRSFAELADVAEEVVASSWDAGLPIRYWLRALRQLGVESKVYYGEGNYDMAFVRTATVLKLQRDVLPYHHPEWRTLPPDQQAEIRQQSAAYAQSYTSLRTFLNQRSASFYALSTPLGVTASAPALTLRNTVMPAASSYSDSSAPPSLRRAPEEGERQPRRSNVLGPEPPRQNRIRKAFGMRTGHSREKSDGSSEGEPSPGGGGRIGLPAPGTAEKDGEEKEWDLVGREEGRIPRMGQGMPPPQMSPGVGNGYVGAPSPAYPSHLAPHPSPSPNSFYGSSGGGGGPGEAMPLPGDGDSDEEEGDGGISYTPTDHRGPGFARTPTWSNLAGGPAYPPHLASHAPPPQPYQNMPYHAPSSQPPHGYGGRQAISPSAYQSPAPPSFSPTSQPPYAQPHSLPPPAHAHQPYAYPVAPQQPGQQHYPYPAQYPPYSSAPPTHLPPAGYPPHPPQAGPSYSQAPLASAPPPVPAIPAASAPPLASPSAPIATSIPPPPRPPTVPLTFSTPHSHPPAPSAPPATPTPPPFIPAPAPTLAVHPPPIPSAPPSATASPSTPFSSLAGFGEGVGTGGSKLARSPSLSIASVPVGLLNGRSDSTRSIREGGGGLESVREMEAALPALGEGPGGANADEGNETIFARTESGAPLRPLVLPASLPQYFMDVCAKRNTEQGIETCGLLLGSLSHNTLSITTLLIPKQVGTPDTCETTNEEEQFAFQDERGLLTLGWIHTHPTQSCFLSSRDLHTHTGYQCMLAEAVAVVCSPRFDPQWGIFRMTDPPGLGTVAHCTETGTFHEHPDLPLYTDCDSDFAHCKTVKAGFECVDLR